jgi:hypothetical protein
MADLGGVLLRIPCFFGRRQELVVILVRVVYRIKQVLLVVKRDAKLLLRIR